MASRSLGTLSVDLIAKIGGFTAGMDAAERQAAKSAKEIEDKIKGISTTSLAVGTALGTYLRSGIDMAIAAFPNLIDQVAQFQDIAEKTGGSAEGFAGFAVSAKVAGTSMEDIANASVKLTKNLTGVDDESKAAGAALAALNVSLEEFKSLSPDQQIAKVAKAMGEFEDGAGKTAVALDLFGKAGANLLPFLKDFEESGGAVNILTAEQIKLADDYGDALTRNRAKMSLQASVIATEMIPVITALTGVFKEVAAEITGFDQKAKGLDQNKSIQAFVDSAVNALGFLLDTVQIVARGFDILGGSIGALAASAVQLGQGNFTAAIRTQFESLKDVGTKIANIGDNLISDRLKKGVAAAREAAREVDGIQKKTLAYSGAQKPTGGGKDTAAQEAKAQLAYDLQQIKAASDALINTYSNQGKVLEAQRSAGLKDEHEYYAEKRRLLEQSNAAEEQSLQDQIARLEQEKLTGKDAIDNQRKIAETQAQLTKVRENAAAAVTVLGIQEQAAYTKIASAILAARQAAQDYFDTTNRGYANELAGFGQGARQRDIIAGLNQISDKYAQQRQDLANRRSQAELAAGGSDKLGPDQRKLYEDQLAIINEFESKALASYRNYTDQKLEIDQDWSKGASEALADYIDKANNLYAMANQVLGNALKGLEDVLVDTIMGRGGADKWKKLGEAIAEEIVRGMVQAQIVKPLAQWGQQLLGAITSGGSGGGQAGAVGDALGSLIQMRGFASGGYTGTGPATQPAGIVHKGEYVLTAEQTARIGVGNLERGNFGGGVTINQSFSPGTDRRTVDQAARSAAMAAQRATARNS